MDTHSQDSTSIVIDYRGNIAQQLSCIWNSLCDSDRYVFHADPGKTECKGQLLKNNDWVGGSLDGAILPGQFADHLDLSSISLLRDTDLPGASLDETDFSEASLFGANSKRLTCSMPTPLRYAQQTLSFMRRSCAKPT
ncbi:pentapeptide repeat-containing protein [Haloquadratum walsbyi]|uniref:pentapeptide repeat-containing protein n=1 Tax=Haloquadratum walsbyi TaxID=293091 RepID=UPI00373FD8CC